MQIQGLIIIDKIFPNALELVVAINFLLKYNEAWFMKFKIYFSYYMNWKHSKLNEIKLQLIEPFEKKCRSFHMIFSWGEKYYNYELFGDIKKKK